MKQLLIPSILLLLFTGSPYLSFAQNSENRSLSSFKAVSVGEAIDVYLIPGSEESVKIKVDNIDLDEVLTDVSGDRLKIHLDRGNHRNVEVDVWVTYKDLESIEVSSAASVVTEGLLKTRSLKIEAESSGNADLEIDVEDLKVDVSSSGEVELSGNANFQNVSVQSAGRYNGFDLECAEAEVSASSAGTARVFVTQKLEADASSAGNIRYKGDPDKVYEDESSGGSVKKY